MSDLLFEFGMFDAGVAFGEGSTSFEEGHRHRTEAEFWDVIKTKVLGVLLLAFHRQLY
jgi:hypothetical protein